jgi:hypothetical protein
MSDPIPHVMAPKFTASTSRSGRLLHGARLVAKDKVYALDIPRVGQFAWCFTIFPKSREKQSAGMCRIGVTVSSHEADHATSDDIDDDEDVSWLLIASSLL